MDNQNKKVIRAVIPDDKVTKGGSITPTAPAAFIDVPRPSQVKPKLNVDNAKNNQK